MSNEKPTRGITQNFLVDVKHAVQIAKDFLREVYADEKLSNLGLEEVTSDEDSWLVTLGFSRPWDYPQEQQALIDITQGLFPKTKPQPEREYKVVRVGAALGKAIDMVNREE